MVQFLVLCSVSGVQAQSITVDRQMKRYRVPRLSFLNKMDRMGAGAEKGARELRENLITMQFLCNYRLVQKKTLLVLLTLVTRKLIYFDGDNGENVRIEDIPADMVDKGRAKSRDAR
jgi:elongation factor G